MTTREQAQRVNPLVGDTPRDTLENCAQAIDAASLFQQADEMPPGASVEWGRYSFMQCVRAALEFEIAQR
jgi:hypothetical protein